MDINDLRRKAVTKGIPQAILEKDYVLSIVLHALCKSKIKDNIVFKGGTAIKKIYFSDARFSEDLDFTTFELDKKDITKELKVLFENKEILNVQFIGLKEEKTSAGLRLSLKFVSLLGQPQSIRFDFSSRGNLFLDPVEKELVDDYSIGKASIKVLQLEELFAEKMHALISRTVVRDLYDVWFFMKNGFRVNDELVKKKFEYYHEKFEFQKFTERMDIFRVKWNQDLRQLLKEVPNFDEVIRDLKNILMK